MRLLTYTASTWCVVPCLAGVMLASSAWGRHRIWIDRCRARCLTGRLACRLFLVPVCIVGCRAGLYSLGTASITGLLRSYMEELACQPLVSGCVSALLDERLALGGRGPSTYGHDPLAMLLRRGMRTARRGALGDGTMATCACRYSHSEADFGLGHECAPAPGIAWISSCPHWSRHMSARLIRLAVVAVPAGLAKAPHSMLTRFRTKAGSSSTQYRAVGRC